MKVEQIATLMNQVTNEVLGTDNIVAPDLANIVDVGTQVFDANAIDNYVRSLVNHIGKVIFSRTEPNSHASIRTLGILPL